MFLVIEGIDGAGKSTLCGKIEEELIAMGKKVIVTQEPTHDEIGSFIREGKVKNISQKAEALLFVADRAVHTERIKEWVDQGNIVICDRYFASTVAYQSSMLNEDAIDREWLLKINEPVIITPDLTVLLDIDPEKGLKRISSRGEISKFEELRYLTGVRMEYLRLADEYDFMVIDAEDAQKDNVDIIVNKMKEMF